MKRYKSTKTALLFSICSMILCVAMLAGSTFAWFTDSASTSVNKIVSGRLDVALNYWDGSDYVSAENVAFFNENDTWEPGSTRVVYLQVKNAGNVSLDYKLSVAAPTETLGINVDGDSYRLSEKLKFKLIEGVEHGAYDRDQAQAATANSTAQGIGAYIQGENPLTKNSVANMALVVYMPKELDNEVNPISDASAARIDLVIKVVAKQATGDADSFNGDYDANTEFDEEATNTTILGLEQLPNGLYKHVNAVDDPDSPYFIKDEASLRAFSAIANGDTDEGKKVMRSRIELLADVTMTQNFTPIGTQLHTYPWFSGIFDGNGHTIKNLRLSDDDISNNEKSMGLAFFGWLGDGAEIKDITFDNANVQSSTSHEVGFQLSARGVVAGVAVGNATFENVHVTNSTVSAFSAVGGILGWQAGGNLTMTGCTVENTTVTATYRCGGLIGLAAGEVSLIDCSTSNVTWIKADSEDWKYKDFVNEPTSLDSGATFNGPKLNGWYYIDNFGGSSHFYAAWGDYYTDTYKHEAAETSDGVTITYNGSKYRWYDGIPHDKEEVTDPTA